jgi:LacI family transcriptional regulator
MANIQDVAKLAGVAPITVSRVINNSGYFSEDTRLRVQSAIAELGYVPNTLARSLRSKRTNTLALVITDITNPFWTTVARGVEDAASSAGFSVIFCNTDESEKEQEHYLNVLMQKRVDGILLVPVNSSIQAIQSIRRQEIPVVVLDRHLSGVEADIVRADSQGGAYELTRLLTALGHRNIAMLAGPRGVSTAEDRAAGFRRALGEVGVTLSAEHIIYGQFSLESGSQMAHQALALVPRPTALFASNNFIAIGAYKVLRELELRVPEDVSLVGFDDLPLSLLVDPFLTAAAQPAYQMGHRATEILLDRLSGKGPAEYEEIILPVELVERKSSGPVHS